LAGNSDGSTTVGDTGGERVDVAGFMSTGETLVVVCAVNQDVLLVFLLKLGNAFLDGLHAGTRLAGLDGGNVGVTTSTVPVTLERFRVERNLDTEFLGDSLEEISCHPEVVTHLNALARTDLEFPLGGHDFGVNTADFDTRVQAGLVVCFYDIASVDLAGTDTTVVWTLWSWETADGPAVRSAEGIEESILLFKTEPRIVLLVFLHQLGAFGAVVELVRCAVRVVAFGENEDVVSTPEGVGVHGNGLKVDIGIVSRSLACEES